MGKASKPYISSVSFSSIGRGPFFPILHRMWIHGPRGILFAINTQYEYTKREKKRSLLKSLKIRCVKKMSQRQKGMQNSLGQQPCIQSYYVLEAKKKLIQMSKYDDDNDVDKEVKEQQKKALDEYPTTFDYDGVYDKMKEKVARPLIQDHEERV
ncbi:nuclear speckle splicing regulatory protein [Trifolium repens]|nr:nuclear speckle splicing regulatory protein [Trifolium repens]